MGRSVPVKYKMFNAAGPEFLAARLDYKDLG